MQEIEVIIENGDLKIQTKGFKGKACLDNTEKLIKLLAKAGIKIDTTDISKTAECYETEEVKEKVVK